VALATHQLLAEKFNILDLKNIKEPQWCCHEGGKIRPGLQIPQPGTLSMAKLSSSQTQILQEPLTPATETKDKTF
jgi:hypothetical protein